jgi:hypothetical protein
MTSVSVTALFEQAAAASRVAAENEVVKCQRAAAVPSAAAAIGPSAGDLHSPQAVLTLIDAKLAEPPFCVGWLAPTRTGTAPSPNAAFGEKSLRKEISPELKALRSRRRPLS